MAKVIAAVAALVAVTADAQLCDVGSGSGETIPQLNSWCGAMNQGSATGGLDACCAGQSEVDNRRLLTGSEPRSLAGEACRAVELDGAYCDSETNPGCAASIGATDILTLSLNMEAPDTSLQCCPECSCIGDPECISFAEVSDEWIICDGRNNDTCTVSKRKCEGKKDHAGNKCKYIKDEPEWVSFSESGSPCQPDWDVSGYPTMTMYEADAFKAELVLGERGVITDINLDLSNGKSLSLNAVKCFSKDKPWTGAKVPSSWEKSETMQDGEVVEITWLIKDPEQGIFATVACTSGAGSEKPRIDITSLIDTNTERIDRAAGFCSSGVISEKGGPRLKERQLHQRCLAENLPSLLVACKMITDHTCGPYNMESKIDEWCEAANIDASSTLNSIDECKSMLKSGSEKERTAAWAETICDLNNKDVPSCVSLISQFGWKGGFSGDYSGGAGAKDVVVGECNSDLSAYSTNNDECAEGVSVEYFADNEWKQAFFIPSDMPPCSDLEITGAQYPNLFKYPIRVAQCDLKPECLVENTCASTPGYSVSFDFTSEECPCPNPLTPGTLVKTDEKMPASYSVSTDIELDTELCTGVDSNVIQYGCDEMYFAVDVKDCSHDAIVYVGVEGQDEPVTCVLKDALTLGETVSILSEVSEDGTLKVTIDNVIVCEEPINGTPKNSGESEDVCLYASAEGKPSAHICSYLPIVTPANLGQCSCRDTGDQPKICEDNTDIQIGVCDECCVDPNTVSDDREALCRDVTMAEPYCDTNSNSEKSMCSKLKGSGSGTMTLNMELLTDVENTCCLSCICYGDPECEAFDGSEDEWILCDARDDTCSISEDVCAGEKDHTGKQCRWDADVAEKLGGRMTDIGAYGSPCLPDFSEEQATMTMYEIDDFSARISMGERGVIETLEVAVAAGTYTLVADECFTANPFESSSSTPLSDALQVVVADAPKRIKSRDEKTVEIVDPESGIFIRVLCIKLTASDGSGKTSFRMNIDNLVEVVPLRANTAAGYCQRKDSVIDTMMSTREHTDEIYEMCYQQLADSHELCKELWSASCTNEQVVDGVKHWCESANVYPNDSNRVEKCKNYIGTSSKKWSELYCDSVNALRPNSMTTAVWRKECMGRLMAESFKSVIEEYGKGSIVSNGVLMCGVDSSSYGKQEDNCTPGVVVETQNAKGVWVEEFFVPAVLPPCGGQLVISAKDHYNLFTRPVRFRQCEIDTRECAVDLGCLPMFNLDIKVSYEQRDSVCARRL